MIRIGGINKKQQQMLDVMWGLDDIDDLEAWKDTLKQADRRQADVLEQLILLAVLDDIFDETEEDYREANMIINNITSKFAS